MKTPRSRFVAIRGLDYHVREWGPDGAPRLWMLHGWMDVSASFQFVVDELALEWHILAPDWRGFGLSGRAPVDCYWFPDYLGDLDLLLDALAPAPAAELVVGHSMGGNVAMLYAGVRPARVRGLVNLEGFGLQDVPAARAPERYARWLDELKDPPRLRDYGSLDEVADRLRRNNPRLSPERAALLAPHWSRPAAGGRLEIAADPAHRLVNPVPYRWAEVAACWDRIACPLLWVEADQTDARRHAGGPEEVARRRAHLPHATHAAIADAGHMLHHDQPRAVAAALEAFVAPLR